MPTLRDRTGVIPNEWLRLDSAAGAPDGVKMILPWQEVMDLPEGVPGYMLGIHVSNGVEPAAIAALFHRVGLISVAFPGFADGRGFSIARKLRALGFKGRLRAAGPVIADQFEYLLACGFDEVETPEALDLRQPQPQWDRALASVSLAYQQGYAGRASIWEARRAARDAR
ncbi:MAG TPA: DUF934 domain-containing protein [Paracoccaceae bacterium]|nr:DUF934 domain-containing protein [Paracoccaceae bacterium]